MTPRLFKAFLLATGFALPLLGTGAAATAHPVDDGHRGDRAAGFHHDGKAARRHARRDARRHARHDAREHARAEARHDAREHARRHARAAHAAGHFNAFGHDGYGYPRYTYRFAYPRVRYLGGYGYGHPHRGHHDRVRHDDDCDRH